MKRSHQPQGYTKVKIGFLTPHIFSGSLEGDAWPDNVPVPSFTRHMRCTRCGNLGASAIPNWIERGNSLPGGTRR